MDELEKYSDFLFYNGKDGKIQVQIIRGDNTVWTSQTGMAEIFGIDRSGIVKHIQNIYESNELDYQATSAKIAQVQIEGGREVKRNVEFYNLDVILAVGYRVNSYNATQFRIWATRILNEFLVKGFVLDDDRLKQGKALFGKDYFNELLERIREIRASERRFYQKITDIYAECSIDYDPNSKITQQFFAVVQNKLEFAITHHTAAEIIKNRADASKPNMGLTTFKNAPNGKVLKQDVTVAKNYLNEEEIKELNAIVNMYLDYAELQASRGKAMRMSDWVQKLDAFLNFNEYDILNNAGRISKAVADAFAEKQFEKYRVIQDSQYESDFDKIISKALIEKKIPIEKKDEEKAFDRQLKGLLKVPPPPIKDKK